MYPHYNIPPPWMWPSGPSTPSIPPANPVDLITGWQRSLDELKKAFKEEKKEEKKKGPEVSLIGTVLFMLLVAPITGPMMYRFFQASLSMMPVVTK